MAHNTVIEELKARIQGLGLSGCERQRSYISSSFNELDNILPNGGLELGSIIEILSELQGTGGFRLALHMGQKIIAACGVWAVLDTEQTFYPPAVPEFLDLKKLILVRTPPQHGAWAFNQLLRSSALGASFFISRSMDNMNFRRFQLAAERGGGLGFALRPLEAQRRPCWASLRMKVERADSHGTFRVTLLHIRGSSLPVTSLLLKCET